MAQQGEDLISAVTLGLGVHIVRRAQAGSRSIKAVSFRHAMNLTQGEMP